MSFAPFFGESSFFFFYSQQHSTMTSSSVRGLALLSGFLGATASCFAKLALEQDSHASKWMIRKLCEKHSNDNFCWVAELVPRGLCLAAMIACNAFMLGSFLEGMEESGSVAGTALATAANFAVSAFYGYILWEERFSTQWMIGFTMVIAGVILLSSVRVQSTSQQTKKDQ